MQIVEFKPCYYSDLARILAEANEHYAFDPDSLRGLDASLFPDYVSRRWMGLYDEVPVAVGEYRHTPEMFHPQEFLLNIAVHPDFQGRGFGQRLFELIVSDMSLYSPRKIRSSCRADRVHSVAFLEHRGFVRKMQILELHLDLEKFNRAPENHASAPGVDIVSLQSLEADPDRDGKLYHLITAIRNEASLPMATTRVSFEHFVASFLHSPSRLPEATFVAVTNGDYGGFSDLHDDGDGGLFCQLTGVRLELRGQGIATALKMAGFRCGHLLGYRRIRTFNRSDNTAILAVNRRMGFQKRFTWLHLEKRMSEE